MQELSDCYNVCVYFQRVTPDMAEFLEELRTRVRVGLVGGSDLCKIKEQLGDDGEAHTSYPSQLSIPQARHQCESLFFCLCAVIQKVDYVFAENGLVAYKNGQLLSVQVRFARCVHSTTFKANGSIAVFV